MLPVEFAKASPLVRRTTKTRLKFNGRSNQKVGVVRSVNLYHVGFEVGNEGWRLVIC